MAELNDRADEFRHLVPITAENMKKAGQLIKDQQSRIQELEKAYLVCLKMTETAKEALDFYANEGNYKKLNISQFSCDGHTLYQEPNVLLDKGEIACKALESIKG